MPLLSRALITFCFTAILLRGEKPTLRITSPPNWTVVHPGDTITMTVEASGGKFVAMVIMPADPIPWGDMRTAPPYRFSVSIPRDITPRLYGIVADGVTESQQRIYSERIYIDVERPDHPVSISTEPEGPIVSHPQDLFILDVIGKYPDGSSEDLTRSTQTKYVSGDSRIVTVTETGVVKSIALGNTGITIRVGEKVMKVPIIVQEQIRE